MTPYYQDKSVTIYHGDCREVMPTLGRFDLLLTDPCYGIGADNRKRILSRAKLAKARDYGESNWDNVPTAITTLQQCISLTNKAIVWGGNYFTLPPSSCWLVWDKVQTGDFADCELAWTNLDKAVRRIVHLWNGMLRKDSEARFHPTQKPVEVFAWCIQQAGEVETIFDPFAGVGTAGRAAKDIGKVATLIEIDERYCEIAARRMEQEVMDFVAPVTTKPLVEPYLAL